MCPGVTSMLDPLHHTLPRYRPGQVIHMSPTAKESSIDLCALPACWFKHAGDGSFASTKFLTRHECLCTWLLRHLSQVR